MLNVLISLLPCLLVTHSCLASAALTPQKHHHRQLAKNMATGSHFHFLDPSYAYPIQDGWQNHSVRWLPDAKSLNRTQSLSQRSSSHPSASHTSSGIGEAVNTILKGVGDAVSVVITWYTGHDLEKPSCWQKNVWTPTDHSYACALTLEGWHDRPKCFDFLELCNTHNKCVFVRVIDTCAGCAPGSKHVDLTKAAFLQMANLDVGETNVKMRKSTLPKKWDTNLYGPYN